MPPIEVREAEFDRITGQFICKIVPGETAADTIRNIADYVERMLGHYLQPDFGNHIGIMVNPPVDVDQFTDTHAVTFVIAAKDSEGVRLIRSLVAVPA